jgi:hypothetical protein
MSNRTIKQVQCGEEGATCEGGKVKEEIVRKYG